MNDQINRASIMEIATYVIADSEIDIDQGVSIEKVLPWAETCLGKDHPYILYLHTAIALDPTIGDIAVLKTSKGKEYSSPMSAACFQNGEDIYILFRGTPPYGWVQNPISYGADISPALAADKISAQIQEDGLDFFDDCIFEFAGYGFPGDRIVGGHSQGANVGEYVTVMSKYAALIDVCVSLNGPNHSRKLYDHVIECSGFDFFNEQVEKIISINGHNDYVNMLGQVEFTRKDKVCYLSTNEVWAYENGHLGPVGWHDLLYMMNRDGSGILPYNAEQGPVGNMMVEINKGIISLPQEEQGDSSMGLMAVLEMLKGSKNWEAVKWAGVDAGKIWELLTAEETNGFETHRLPEIFGQMIAHPGLLSQTLNGLVPPHIKEQVEYNNECYFELVHGSTGGYSGSEDGAEVVILELIVSITAVFCLIVVAAVNTDECMELYTNNRVFDEGVRNLFEMNSMNSKYVRIFVETWEKRLRTWAKVLNVRSGSFPDDQGMSCVAANPYFHDGIWNDMGGIER